MRKEKPRLSNVRNSQTLTYLSKAVRAKIEDGNVKAAVRILLSEDTPAVPSEEYWRQLCEKHLPAFKSDAVLRFTGRFTSLKFHCE